jgi:hypothetical protein
VKAGLEGPAEKTNLKPETIFQPRAVASDPGHIATVLTFGHSFLAFLERIGYDSRIRGSKLAVPSLP